MLRPSSPMTARTPRRESASRGHRLAVSAAPEQGPPDTRQAVDPQEFLSIRLMSAKARPPQRPQYWPLGRSVPLGPMYLPKKSWKKVGNEPARKDRKICPLSAKGNIPAEVKLWRSKLVFVDLLEHSFEAATRKAPIPCSGPAQARSCYVLRADSGCYAQAPCVAAKVGRRETCRNTPPQPVARSAARSGAGPALGPQRCWGSS